MLYAADFETTTDPKDCRVWAWGAFEIGSENNFHYGNTIDGFMDFAKNSDNSTFYFHNEKFDGEFLFSWLFKNGFKHTKGDDPVESKTFSTLISDMGMFYSIEIVFERKGRRYNRIKILDSLKIIPFSVDEVAKAFGLPINKLKIDYKKFRPVGYELEDYEILYLRHDVEIMARSLDVLFKQGLNNMTQGKNALEDYREMKGKKEFARLFPTPDFVMDTDLRQSYKGGFTYVKDEYKERNIWTGFVMDVNSLYPWVLHSCLLPYGEPISFEGQYEYDELYPLYIQMIRCTFELKPNHIPTMQIKDGDYPYPKTQYLKSSVYEWEDSKGNEHVFDEEVVICLTNVDLELFLEHYDVEIIEYMKGWKFKGSTELFKDYVEKWTKIKIESTLNGNKGMRTLAKLMQNALYGKFGSKIRGASKYPYEDEGIIRYKTGEIEERKAVYIPIASFVTAYARKRTITSAQKVYKYFVYADTDSLHLDIPLPEELKNMSEKEFEKLTTKDIINYGVDIPEDFEIDPVSLGAWKLESKFNRARFLRQKSYIEDSNSPEVWGMPKYSTKAVKQFCEDMELDFDKEIVKYEGLYDTDKLKITCAGMSARCYPYVNWDNFHILSSFKGKLTPTHVEGGIVLKEDIFTIRPA